MPSDEIIMVPWFPTAPHCVPAQTIPARLLVVVDVREVHVIPSVEVTMAPAFPTATTKVPLPATALRLEFVFAVREVQVTPSGDVRMVAGVEPSVVARPTATNCVP